jgi:uncharacterized membrane protein
MKLHCSGAKRIFISVKNTIRNRIFAGIIVIVPLAITFYIFKFILSFLDSFAAPLIEKILKHHIPGLGILITLIFTYLVGLLTANVAGKKIVAFGESILSSLPVIKNVYGGAKQLIAAFSFAGKSKFNRVILVVFPRKGLWSIGFVTKDFLFEHENKPMISIFVPTTPNPTTGFYLILPKQDIVNTKLSIEEGVKLVVSGGIIAPDHDNFI